MHRYMRPANDETYDASSSTHIVTMVRMEHRDAQPSNVVQSNSNGSHPVLSGSVLNSRRTSRSRPLRKISLDQGVQLRCSWHITMIVNSSEPSAGMDPAQKTISAVVSSMLLKLRRTMYASVIADMRLGFRSGGRCKTM